MVCYLVVFVFVFVFLFGQLEIYRLINFKEKMARSREPLSHICVVCAGVCLQCVLLNHRKPLIMGKSARTFTKKLVMLNQRSYRHCRCQLDSLREQRTKNKKKKKKKFIIVHLVEIVRHLWLKPYRCFWISHLDEKVKEEKNEC